MASQDTSLSALEALMTEFFCFNTSNVRKRQIEEILDSFKNQPECWHHCLNFLSNTSNEYVMMYCLNVIEHVINKVWIRMPGPDKAELRSTLHRFMISHHLKVPNYICNKLGKLIVDIGRLDWPHFYPDFFMNIHQLAQAAETAPLGLMLIQTAFEEFTSPREDLAVTRKEELHRLMLEQVPIVLNILSGHLDAVLEKHSHLVTATPPPSPTHYQNNSQQTLFSTSPLHTGSLLSGMFKSTSKNPFQCMPPLDDESHQLSVLSLKCLAQLLSWIPLSSYITSSLLTTVFHFASFGCHPEPVMNVGMQQAQTLRKNTDLGIQAMGCINEIMSKLCIPTDYEGFLLQVFQDTFHLLQNLTKDNSKNASSRNTLADIDDVYVEKFTDFLMLFVTYHLKRFESNAQFPILEFLALLFKYTFQQPSHDGFYSCLEVWNIFLDYLSYKLKNDNTNYEMTLNKYKDALLALVQEIFRKLQFRYNQSSLEELDDEDLDDDSFTEWQLFLCQCLEIASKISELLPNEIFHLVFSVFEENLRIYFDLEQFLKPPINNSPVELSVCGENECRRLHCSLRDLSSMLQALGRLVVYMSGDHFVARKVDAQKTLEKLCHAATYSNRYKFYEIKTAAPLVLKVDFIEVHAQILATLKAFCYWLTQYVKDAGEENSESSVEKVIAEIAIANIKRKVPEKVTHSAAHLLISLTATVKPSYLFQFIPVQELLTAIGKLELRFLPIETQIVVYRSMSNVLVLPWGYLSDSQQMWPIRSSHHDHLIQSLCEPLRSACSSPNFFQDKMMQEHAKPNILWVLKVMCGLIENVSDGSTRTKNIFYKSLQHTISYIESLFHLYLQHSDVTESILDFYLCLFSAFRIQIGHPFVQKTIQNFLTLFSSSRVMEFTLNECSSGCKVVEKLLQLLQQVVQEPSSHFKAFLPSTISLCLCQIYPLVAEKPSSEVKPPLFELLHKILLHNYKYFFKVNVINSLGESGNEKIENEHHFTKIMEAYGQSFLQPDINLFKQNITSLETLNTKWKLYYKGYFKSVMLLQFLSVLMKTLIYKTHNLLREEIINTIYNMALVDFHSFYSVFLPQFLQNIENLDANQKSTLLRNFKHETDLHSFAESVQRFVSDLRYYCLCTNATV